MAFKSQLKKYTTEDFWKVIKIDVPEPTRNAIETYRNLVLNPFSHYNTERHEIQTELTNAISTVKALKTELSNL